MNAGKECEVPHDYSREDVQVLVLYLECVESCQDRKYQSGVSKVFQMQGMSGVEYGEHYNRPNVIYNGQGCQEYLQARRYSVPEQGEDANRESYVCGHGDSPALDAFGVPGVECPVYPGRYQHAAQRRDYRKGGPLYGRKLANEHLTLYLESYDEEENGHQRVVDPVPQ